MATLQERIDAAMLLVGSDIGDLAAEINGSNRETTQVQLKDLAEQIKTLNDTMLYFVTAILDKMPRIDTTDRLPVSVETGILTTVSNVYTVSNLTALNGFSGGNSVFIPQQVSNIGALHLYDKIVIT